MNKIIQGLILSMGLGLLSSPVMATIEQECSASNNHGAHVCEYIYMVRESLAQNKPPEPFVELSLQGFQQEDYSFDAPSVSGDSSDPCSQHTPGTFAYNLCRQQNPN